MSQSTSRPILVAGRWMKTSEPLKVVYPYTGEELFSTFKSSPELVEEALAAAEKSFTQTKRLSSKERKEILRKTAEGIKECRAELAQIMCLENGKPITAALVEVDRAALTFSVAAEEASRISGEVLPIDLNQASQNRVAIWSRVPIGPITAVTPFNFPLNLAAHKLAPAMACGNPVLLRPSSKTPITALMLAEIILAAGWPPQALSVLPATYEVSAPLVEDDRIKLVSFTGSPLVGWELKKRAGKKRVTLELGGNAALVVHQDADIEQAVARSVTGAFAFSGQVCISLQRIFVNRPVYEEFLAKLIDATLKLTAGNPLDPTTQVSAMIDEANARRIESWVKEAEAKGAKIHCGGKRRGNFYEPTVLSGVDPTLKIWSREAFGPVVAVAPYDDYAAALNAVNDSAYGLQAGVFTNDINRVAQAFRTLEVGGVIINDVPTYRIDNMPYGGVKGSGLGREGPRFAVEEMTEIKLLVINLQPPAL